jgi:hypothetical protein
MHLGYQCRDERPNPPNESAVDCKLSTDIRRQCAVNCELEQSVLPNAAEKIGGTRYRPERRFVMSQETLRQISRQT